MRIGVLKETAAGERRVAATPEAVKKFVALGTAIAVETGAGAGSYFSDQDFTAAGATICDRSVLLADCDALLGVQGPDPATLAGVKPGTCIVASLNPFAEAARIDAYATLGTEALALEFMPRITRCQSMDILSSQSNLAGYKAVVDAAQAEHERRLRRHRQSYLLQ